MQNNFYYGYNRDKTRLGFRRTMERSTIYETLGKQSQSDQLLAIIESGYTGTSDGSISLFEQANKFSRIIETKAKENGFWIDDFSKVLIDGMIGRGGESEVFLSKDGKRAIKKTHLTFFSNSEDLIYKIGIHNLLFPEVRYDIIGFGRDSQNRISVILEQPYIIANTRATQKQISDYMNFIGFESEIKIVEIGGGIVESIVYQNSDLRISDAVIKDSGDNVLIDLDGNLCFIDAFIVPAMITSG
jgi:hypothetical protein